VCARAEAPLHHDDIRVLRGLVIGAPVSHVASSRRCGGGRGGRDVAVVVVVAVIVIVSSWSR